MIKDQKVSEMFTLLRYGSSVADTARMLTMSKKTVRKYRDKNVLPSQIERPERAYRTRVDPLERFWPEVQEQLENDHRLKPYALLEWLQQKYNSADDSSAQLIVPDSLRRTLERRVQNWKLQHDINKEVIFPQIHHPGDVLAFDFVDLNCLHVTIAGEQFDHKLFHAVLTYSNWEHVHLCHSESFEALATGLQDALHLAGGVPKRVRSDSLSAAVNNLTSEKEFARQYKNLLSHYGLQGHRINVRKPQENGDVESSNRHIKTAVDQSLRLRGNREFSDVKEYQEFLLGVVAPRNVKRDAKLLEEIAQFRSLPAQRVATYTTLNVKVKSDCVIRVKRNSYSVSSKYISLKLEIRINQDHVELWYSGERMEVMPRLYGRDKETIDFRHVIDSLKRKPGAFANYKYQHHLYPTTRFRMAYDALLKHTTEASAVKQYLKILHAAKHEGLDTVDDILRFLLLQGEPPLAAKVLGMIASKQQVPSPTELDVEPPDLNSYDSLLPHKDVYDDPKDHSGQTQSTTQASVLENSGLDVAFSCYDEHLSTSRTTEGTASTDDPRTAHHDRGSGSPRPLDSPTVLVGVGIERMHLAAGESDRAIDEGCSPIAGQDVGAISVVSFATACDSAIRSSSQRQLFRSPGQLVDFRKAWFGENEFTFGVGRSTGASWPIGLFHDLPDVGARPVACQTRFTDGTSDQEAEQVRCLDRGRPGVRATESRRDGSVVHAALRTLRTGQRVTEQQSTVLEVGTDLQRSNDDRCSDRSVDPPLGNHRAEHRQLSPGESQGETFFRSALRWFQAQGTSLVGKHSERNSNCR